MLRNVIASLAIGAVLASCASAALTTSVTLSRNPTGTPPVLFATDTGLNTAPNDGWVSFVLGVNNSAGVITGIDARITGPLLQRWNISEGDDGPVIVPTPNITGTTNGDSHLLASPAALIGAALTENNNANNGALAFPADTASRDYGIGSSLSGAWGIPAAEQTSAVNFAYIVVPKSSVVGNGFGSSIVGLNLEVQVGLPGGQFQTLTTQDFFPVGVAPIVLDIERFSTVLGDVISATLVDVAPASPPATWSALTGPAYTPGFGAPPTAPGLGPATFSWNPATQAFQFNTLGATRGTYVWNGTASNTTGSDSFSIKVLVGMPEPGTLSLLGLALVGVTLSTRRR